MPVLVHSYALPLTHQSILLQDLLLGHEEQAFTSCIQRMTVSARCHWPSAPNALMRAVQDTTSG